MLVVMTAAALQACSSADSRTGASSVSASAPSSVSPVPRTAPTATATASTSEAAAIGTPMPETARRHDGRGAEAFTRWIVTSRADAFDNYDVSLWDRVPQTSTCMFCRYVHEEVAKLQKTHQTMSGDSTQVLWVSASLDSDGSSLASLMLTEPSSTLYASDGRVLGAYPEQANLRMDMRLLWANDHWVLAGGGAPVDADK